MACMLRVPFPREAQLAHASAHPGLTRGALQGLGALVADTNREAAEMTGRTALWLYDFVSALHSFRGSDFTSKTNGVERTRSSNYIIKPKGHNTPRRNVSPQS